MGAHGAYAVVFGGGEDERLGVSSAGLELVVGRDGGEEFALLGDGDGAVLADPGGPGGDVFEAEHVEEGYLDDDGSGERSMAWVNAENERSAKALDVGPIYTALAETALKVLESPTRLPTPQFRVGEGLAVRCFRGVSPSPRIRAKSSNQGL